MSNLQNTLARLLLAALLACGAGQAAAVPLYKVRIDTASLGSGPAYLGLYFMGLADATPGTATVTGLAGELAGLPDTSGSVVGSAPGPIEFSNANGGSDWVQAVALGGVFSFDVSFLMGQGDVGSVFGWALFNDTSYLGADGDLGTVALQPVLGGSTGYALTLGSRLVQVQAIAEPGTAWLLLLALPLLALARRRA